MRVARRVLPLALLALAPKCLLCLTAYAGFGAWLGLGGAEICGAVSKHDIPWLSWLASGGAAAMAVGIIAIARGRASPAESPQRAV